MCYRRTLQCCVWRTGWSGPAAECQGSLEEKAGASMMNKHLESHRSHPTRGRRAPNYFLNFWELKVDLSSLSLLNPSAAASHGGADLHCGCYYAISLSSSILTADWRGNVQRRGGKDWRKISERTRVSGECWVWTHTHTLRHSRCLPLFAWR